SPAAKFGFYWSDDHQFPISKSTLRAPDKGFDQNVNAFFRMDPSNKQHGLVPTANWRGNDGRLRHWVWEDSDFVRKFRHLEFNCVRYRARWCLQASRFPVKAHLSSRIASDLDTNTAASWIA